MIRSILAVPFAALLLLTPFSRAKEIVHDAEHYMLLAQHGDRWAAEDNTIETKLAEIRKANDGQRPNIFFILIDDIGFGEIGTPELNHVRGYTTPNINDFARQSLSFSRIYTEFSSPAHRHAPRF